jgi:hypothetical protein
MVFTVSASKILQISRMLLRVPVRLKLVLFLILLCQPKGLPRARLSMIFAKPAGNYKPAGN